jgi:hypothetical protein
VVIVQSKANFKRTRNAVSKKFALITLSFALVFTVSFPLSALAEEVDPALEASEVEATTLAEETEAVEGEDLEAAEEVVEEEAGEITPLAGSWTAYTGALTADITTFAVAGNPNLTGHLGVGSPTYVASQILREAGYYLVYDNGVDPVVDVTYAFDYNDFSTSDFWLFVDDNSASPATSHLVDIGKLSIDSVWVDTTVPGYTSLQLRGVTSVAGTDLNVSVTMVPHADGGVDYIWEVIPKNTPVRRDLSIGAAFNIDTMLQDDDHVPVYSSGGLGMYIDDAAAFSRVTFPAVPVANGGPIDTAADSYSADSRTVFGTPQNAAAMHAAGDVLLSNADTAVFFLYGYEDFGDAGRQFVYTVGLGEATPIVPILPDPILPPTGDTALPLLATVALLAVAGIGTITFACARRSRKQL